MPAAEPQTSGHRLKFLISMRLLAISSADFWEVIVFPLVVTCFPSIKTHRCCHRTSSKLEIDKLRAFVNSSHTQKDAPFPRAIEHLGVITSRPVLGDLHHQYCRI